MKALPEHRQNGRGNRGGARGVGEVSPSAPLMPIVVLSSVPSQIAVGSGPYDSLPECQQLANAGRPTACARPQDGPNRPRKEPSPNGRLMARMPFWCICAGAAHEWRICNAHLANFALHQAGRHARRNNALKEVPKDVTLPKAVQPVLRKRGVMRNLVIEIEPAEPAIGQMQFDFLRQPAFRPSAKAVADNQHSDHKFGINRRPPNLAVIGF